jgi:hypothetical protein
MGLFLSRRRKDQAVRRMDASYIAREFVVFL